VSRFCRQRGILNISQPYRTLRPVTGIDLSPQLYSWGWVDPVPDPLLLRKSGSAGNRTREPTEAVALHMPTFKYEYYCYSQNRHDSLQKTRPSFVASHVHRVKARQFVAMVTWNCKITEPSSPHYITFLYTRLVPSYKKKGGGNLSSARRPNHPMNWQRPASWN
jgi:hypothetical protein